MSSQLPASVVLNRTPEGTYLIDADKSVGGDSGSNVLSQLGNVLEKFLTYDTDEFERFDVKSKNPFRPEESREKREAYHYSGVRTNCVSIFLTKQLKIPCDGRRTVFSCALSSIATTTVSRARRLTSRRALR
jgi:hypothetical protein